LAWIAYDAGEYDLAAEYCEKAMELGQAIDPDFLKKIKPYRKKSIISYGDDTFLTAEELAILQDLSSEVFKLYEQGLEAYEKEEYSLALEYDRKVLSRVVPNTAEYYVSLKLVIFDLEAMARSYWRNGFYDAAIDYLKKEVNMIGNPKDDIFSHRLASCYHFLGTIYLDDKGDIPKAESYLNKLKSFSIFEAEELKADLERWIQDKKSKGSNDIYF